MPILGKCFYFSATQYCQLAVSEPGLLRLEVQQEPGSLQPVNPSSIRIACRAYYRGGGGAPSPGFLILKVWVGPECALQTRTLEPLQ